MHSCFSPLQGFLDAVIYGLSTSDIAALRHKLKTKKVKETPKEPEAPKRFSTATIINIFCFILFILIRGTINLIISYGTEVAPPVEKAFACTYVPVFSALGTKHSFSYCTGIDGYHSFVEDGEI